MKAVLKVVFLSILFFCLSGMDCFAYPLTIVPNGALPQTVPLDGTTTASYLVINNTARQRNNNYVQYLPPNVSVTSGGCGSIFNLAPSGQGGDSCILNLLITAPVNGNDPDPTHHLFVCFPGGLTCVGTDYPLNVTQGGPAIVAMVIAPTSASVAAGLTQPFTASGTFSDGSTGDVTNRVSWSSNNTAVATINNTGLATGVSVGSASITASSGTVTSNAAALTVTAAVLTSIAVTPSSVNLVVNGTQQFTATGTFTDGSTQDLSSSATWNSTSTDVATINSSGVASTLTLGTTNISASSGSITSNAASLLVTQFAYVVNNSASTVSYCVLGGTGTFGACNQTGSGLTNPAGIAINTTNKVAYVVNNGSNTVSYCNLNFDGSFGTCTPITAGGSLSFNSPRGISLDPTFAFAYITNSGTSGIGSNTVYSCPISNVDGSLSTCNDTTGNNFSSPYGIVIDAANAFAYVTNFSTNNVVSCQINGSGIFVADSCTDTTGTGFTGPAGITLSSDGTLAYIANNQSTTLSFCTVAGGGLFGACNTTGTFFALPFGVAVTASTAYVTNNSLVSNCAISQDDGSLSNCDTTGSGFSGSGGIFVP